MTLKRVGSYLQIIADEGMGTCRIPHKGFATAPNLPHNPPPTYLFLDSHTALAVVTMLPLLQPLQVGIPQPVGGSSMETERKGINSVQG